MRARPEDIVGGVAIADGGATSCWATGARLRAGDRAIVYFYRDGGSEVWNRAGIYHPSAADIMPMEPPADEIWAKGTLAVCSDPATQAATLHLRDVDVVATFAAEE